MKMLEEEYNAIRIPNEESVVTYYKIRQQLAKLGKEIEEFIHKPRYCLPFLQPGRLVRVNVQRLFLCIQTLNVSSNSTEQLLLEGVAVTDLVFLVCWDTKNAKHALVFHIQVKKEDLDFGWGLVVNFQKKTNVKVSPYALCV